jgi:hypothetical protein
VESAPVPTTTAKASKKKSTKWFFLVVVEYTLSWNLLYQCGNMNKVLIIDRWQMHDNDDLDTVNEQFNNQLLCPNARMNSNYYFFNANQLQKVR